MRSIFRLTPLLVLASVAACSGTSSSDDPTGRVAVKLSTVAPAMANAGSSLLAPGLSVTLGADVLLIDDVQMVVRKVKLERADGTCPTPVVDESSGSGSDADEAETDECPNLQLGPLLFDPPLGEGGVLSAFTVDIPAGTYDKVMLQIHKPTGSKDAAFLAANPGFAGVSIKVAGSFNGVPFTFTTALTTVVEMQLPQAIVVEDGKQTDLTLNFDVRNWFKAEGGASLINPLTLSQQNRSRIEQSIRASFRAFKDQNGDGRED